MRVCYHEVRERKERKDDGDGWMEDGLPGCKPR